MNRLFNDIAYGQTKNKPRGIVTFLLSPLYLLSLLYSTIVKFRLFLYREGILKSKEIDCKVISVGNITVGGTGKTPTVEFLARQLNNRGYKVAILSRGYKGKKTSEINIVSDGKNIYLGPDESGDEPYMLAKKLKNIPVLVGSNRYKLADYAVKNLGINTILLDDGFQHIQLKRDLDILLVDGKKGFGNGYTLPRGPLREPVSSIRRAALTMITKADGDTEEIKKQLEQEHPSIKIIKSTYKPKSLKSVLDPREKELSDMKGKNIFTLSAIANPSYFSMLIKSLGGVITGESEFPDHYSYTLNDMETVIEKAKKAGADYVVTTEKDAVKLEKLSFSADLPVYFLEIGLDLLGREEEFINSVLKESGLETSPQ